MKRTVKQKMRTSMRKFQGGTDEIIEIDEFSKIFCESRSPMD